MTFPKDYDRIHPFYKDYVIKQANKIESTNVEEEREIRKQQYRAERENVPKVLCSSYTIPMDETESESDIKTAEVYVIRPPDTETTILPVMVFMHGGGYMYGDKETYEIPIGDLALRAQAAIVFVEYSRIPEVQYPVALNQVWTAIRWVHQSSQLIHVDPSTLIVAGDSAGGNLAAAACLLAKQRGEQDMIHGQILIYPVLDFARPHASDPSSSVALYGQGPEFGLPINLVYRSQRLYCGQQTTTNILLSPTLASTTDLEGLPPTLIATAEFDPLRDEGEAYANQLMQAGVHVAAIRVLGTIHAFFQMNKVPSYSQLLGSMTSFMQDVFKK
ncbi:hypothetical protein K492DRAFT_147473 [Lichtheimia hyalospora FSU 10163]|nr:hypothetical protein K492DRAFT_147473 [Lichtheimia hyalospora FSU 10163]